MDSRFHRLLQLAIAAAIALTASLPGVAHAIPKAAEDANGSVSFAPDVPRPKTSTKVTKPGSKQSAKSASKTKKAQQATKGGKRPSAKSAGKSPSKKTIRGKK